MKRKLAGILCLLLLLEELAPATHAYAADVPDAAYIEEYENDETAEAKDQSQQPADITAEELLTPDAASGFRFYAKGEQVSELSLFVGESISLSLDGEGDAASVTYSSSNAKVAKVDALGTVTGVKAAEDSVTISAKSGNVVLASVEVTVEDMPASKALTLRSQSGNSVNYASVSAEQPKLTFELRMEYKVYNALKDSGLDPEKNISAVLNTEGSTAEAEIEGAEITDLLDDEAGMTVFEISVCVKSPGLLQLNAHVGAKTATQTIMINQNLSGMGTAEVWADGAPASGWVGEKIYVSRTKTNRPRRDQLESVMLGSEALCGQAAVSYFTSAIYKTQSEVPYGKWNEADALIYPGAFFYADPETHMPKFGFLSYGGKLYYTLEGACGIQRAGEDNETDMEVPVQSALYLYNTKGEVLCGTLLFDKDFNLLQEYSQKAKYLYYADGDGRVRSGVWAPLKDSWCWIPAGEDHVELGKAEGIRYIEEQPFYIYQDVRLLGWIYLKKNKLVETAEEADTIYYADPDSGVLCEGRFLINGREYYQSVSDDNLWWNGFKKTSGTGLAKAAVSENLVLYSNVDKKWYCVDDTGVILDDVLVDRVVYKNANTSYQGVWIDRSTEDGLYYGLRVVDGRTVKFDPGMNFYDEGITNGKPYKLEDAFYCNLADGAVDLSVVDDERSHKELYLRDTVKNNKVSFALYTDAEATKAVKNAIVVIGEDMWIYGGDGKPKSGLVKAVNGKQSTWVLASAADGRLRKADVENNGVVTYGSKRYLLDGDGYVVTRAMTEEGLGISDDGYCVDKNGVLLTGFQTVGGKRYYFDPDSGEMATEIFWYKNKYYLPQDEGVLGGSLAGLSAEGWVEKDGSLRQGWIYLDANDKLTSYKKAVSRKYFLDKGYLNDEKALYKISGKYYHFAKDGELSTGFTVLQLETIYDLAGGKERAHTDGTYYFNPAKSGVMASGWVKVNGSSYYFAPAEVTACDADGKAASFGIGQRISAASLTIGKQLYRFDENGVSTKLSSGRLKNPDKSYSYVEQNSGVGVTNALRFTGSKAYWYAEDGKARPYASAGRFTSLSGSSLYPVFAKDGTLSAVKTAGGTLLTNTLIKAGGQYVKLDAKGKPATGVGSGIEDGSRIYVWIEKDGRQHKAAADYELLKDGGNYYLCGTDGKLRTSFDWLSENEIADDVTALVSFKREKLDISGLSASEKKDLQAAMAASETLKLAVGSDGRLKRSAKLYVGTKLYLSNTYGVVIDAAITRSGSKYYTSLGVAGKSSELTAVELSTGRETTLKIAVKPTGELRKITDVNDKAVSGVYRLDNGLTIYVKSGKAASGTATLNLGGSKVNITFDRDMPVRTDL